MLDIGDVAKATGLTLRALRFYEGRGLVRPLRTAGGRRVYGRGELARLNAAVALKRAGFSLAKIADLLAGRTVDLARLIAAQIAEVDSQASALAESRDLLLTVQSRIDRGEPIDVATLCSLIRSGDDIMEPEHWQAITDRYFTTAERAEWSERMAAVGDDFTSEAYAAKWQDLGARIGTALPLDPASEIAQGFVDDWFALLKPFTAVATPAMWNGTVRMYDDMASWEGQVDPGFGKSVWDFIKLATAARSRRAARSMVRLGPERRDRERLGFAGGRDHARSRGDHAAQVLEWIRATPPRRRIDPALFDVLLAAGVRDHANPDRGGLCDLVRGRDRRDNPDRRARLPAIANADPDRVHRADRDRRDRA